jgi:cyclophilin family peptidyl-prolyl cis-trans isomerase
MKQFVPFVILAVFTIFTACSNSGEPHSDAAPVLIEMETNYGTILIRLYDETPLHRDNFKTLVSEGFYDSLQFHRIIENFVVQGGDPDTRYLPLSEIDGLGGLEYTIPAEFHPKLFHKRGSLGAARSDNPERESSSTQFYFVQGRVANDSLLAVADTRINQWIAQYQVRKIPEYAALEDSAATLWEAGLTSAAEELMAEFRQKVDGFDDFERYVIPDNHIEVYRTIGGIPHLDQNYTVFGEVIEGMDVIDRMAAVETNELDRPIPEIRLIRASVVGEDN